MNCVKDLQMEFNSDKCEVIELYSTDKIPSAKLVHTDHNIPYIYTCKCFLSMHLSKYLLNAVIVLSSTLCCTLLN